MASSNHTPQFSLCQWLAEDPILREDFNEDNQTIESALYAALPVCGTYTGIDDSSSAAPQNITLGFAPQAVLCIPNGGVYMTSTAIDFSMAIQGQDAYNLKLTDTGFSVSRSLNIPADKTSTYAINKNPYRYIAWRKREETP